MILDLAICLVRFQNSPSFAVKPPRSSLHPRNMRVPQNVKSPRLVLVLTRVIDTNTRTRSDSADLQFAIFDPQGTAGEICTIEPLVDPHRHAKLAGTAGDVGLPPRGFSEPFHDSHVVN